MLAPNVAGLDVEGTASLEIAEGIDNCAERG
jgi:hypothetical protein